jgi:hypothetical protein
VRPRAVLAREGNDLHLILLEDGFTTELERFADFFDVTVICPAATAK